MVRQIGLVLLIMLAAPATWAAELLASVDRKEIGRSDAVTLQVRYTDMAGFSSPDWRPLDREWDVVSKNQSQQISFNNGKNSSYTDWTLTLIPRRSGELLIPPIEFKGAKSEPIRIQVSEQANTQAKSSDNFYFEVEVSSGTHYVQEQLLYIERLYYTVNHDDANLSEFTVAGARVQPLMDAKQYVTVVDGKRVGVYERRYAIFPEKAGTIVIPGQRFTARIPNRYDRFRGTSDSVISKPIELDIKPIPKNYPQAPWIPASKFDISEEFSRDLSEWRVGEPVTRTMTIQATGLSKGQIPPIPMPEIDSLRYYPDQTQDDTQVTEQGMVSNVVQSVALVPTQPGKMTLPEIRIPWWNTLTNTIEYAVLPARSVVVAEAKAPAISGNQPEPLQTASDTPAVTLTLPEGDSRYWMGMVALLMITNLITLVLLFRRRSPARTEPREELAPQTDTRSLWRDFRRACQNNDPAAIRSSLIAWAAAASGWNISAVAEVEVWLNDVRLSAALAELDATLYSNKSNSAFNGQGILNLVEKALRQNTERTQEESLPELYS
ncbi:BatD family protein [Thalassolituus sp.]|uniref:BatD family protein n=1 Tax=Thalassolituus sp. TaxID=2030822 RepID=UPI0035163ACD